MGKKEKKNHTLLLPTSEQYQNLLTNISNLSECEAKEYQLLNNITVEIESHNNEIIKPCYPLVKFSDTTSILPNGLLKICDKFEDKPSPIQSQTWPYALSFNKSIVGVAETGSGKTIAFGLPAIAKVHFSFLTNPKKQSPLLYSPSVLILVPTRELAMQIEETIQNTIEGLNPNTYLIKSMAIYGGVDRASQLKTLLSFMPEILIATPGRLLDFQSESKLSLKSVSYFVLDEADRMLDMGFAADVKRIARAMESNTPKQMLMFSATWPPAIRKLADSLIKGSIVRISITAILEEKTTNSLRGGSSIKQIISVVNDVKEKEHLLHSLLSKYSSGKIILFVLYKKEADRIESLLMKRGLKLSTIHGDKTQPQRNIALQSFKTGKVSILIATDVASRGLDIPFVETVINYTFPLTIEDYIHRIGRTGRAGKSGIAHTIFSPLDKSHSGELIAVLRNSGQNVPTELLAFGTTTKKREHKDYGTFYKELDPTIKPKHMKFDDNDN